MFVCGLTCELSRHRRWDARPRRQKMYTVPVAGAWWPAVGARLERGVRLRWVRPCAGGGPGKAVLFLVACRRCRPLRADARGMPRIQAATFGRSETPQCWPRPDELTQNQSFLRSEAVRCSTAALCHSCSLPCCPSRCSVAPAESFDSPLGRAPVGYRALAPLSRRGGSAHADRR